MSESKPGRPPLRGVRKVRLDLRVTPDVREFLKSREVSAGEYVEAMVRKSRAFRSRTDVFDDQVNADQDQQPKK